MASNFGVYSLLSLPFANFTKIHTLFIKNKKDPNKGNAPKLQKLILESANFKVKNKRKHIACPSKFDTYYTE